MLWRGARTGVKDLTTSCTPPSTDAVAGEGWVIDGNYGKTRDLVWASADTVVWLDYRFPRVFTRLLQRTFRRTLRREILWHGNRERLRTAFLLSRLDPAVGAQDALAAAARIRCAPGATAVPAPLRRSTAIAARDGRMA